MRLQCGYFLNVEIFCKSIEVSKKCVEHVDDV